MELLSSLLQDLELDPRLQVCPDVIILETPSLLYHHLERRHEGLNSAPLLSDWHRFLAPEELENGGITMESGVVYRGAVITCYLLSGGAWGRAPLPFAEAHTVQELLEYASPPSLSSISHWAAETQFCRLLDLCLSKDPLKRPSSLNTLKRALVDLQVSKSGNLEGEAFQFFQSFGCTRVRPLHLTRRLITEGCVPRFPPRLGALKHMNKGFLNRAVTVMLCLRDFLPRDLAFLCVQHLIIRERAMLVDRQWDSGDETYVAVAGDLLTRHLMKGKSYLTIKDWAIIVKAFQWRRYHPQSVWHMVSLCKNKFFENRRFVLSDSGLMLEGLSQVVCEEGKFRLASDAQGFAFSSLARLFYNVRPKTMAVLSWQEEEEEQHGFHRIRCLDFPDVVYSKKGRQIYVVHEGWNYYLVPFDDNMVFPSLSKLVDYYTKLGVLT